ncbi:MAG: PQQ-dependent sugar dehydrogenase, partial [bacterium]|nr:PQQ-dependent sugar dehydrogenase [bacterium]
IFAKDLPGARVMAQDSFGNWWVSQTADGIVSLVEVKDGKATKHYPMFTNLRKPHGLAFDPQNPFKLYVAEEDKISYITTYSEDSFHKIVDLPAGDGHFTRTIAFGPDDRLYVSIGSSCNVCRERDERRAKIFSMKKDGSDFKEFARGLRNAVFFTWSYVDGRMWVTEMGRDLIGNDIPPDEIDVVEAGKNYGWPVCYGKNVHDTDFDKNTYIRNPCMEPFETPSYIDIQAHSAPLGLAFVPEDPPAGGWPEDYWYNLIVAYHGSWNRDTPTGYKVVRIKLDSKGKYLGTEDFITGWLTKDQEALGRPVDIVIQPGGMMFITDDKAEVIYEVNFKASAMSGTPEPAPAPNPGRVECKPTGCSGQICSDEDMITTCEYRAEYACYKGAKCEQQASGKCGWTQTQELQSCLKKY